MTTIDFGPAIAALAPLALAAVTAAVPYLIVLFQKHTSIKLTEQQVQVITDACDRGAELMYGRIVSAGATAAHVAIRSGALAAGVNHVLASVPDALKKLGITPDQVERMVEARFGGLLAKDKNVSVAPAPMVRGLTPITPPKEPETRKDTPQATEQQSLKTPEKPATAAGIPAVRGPNPTLPPRAPTSV